MKSDLNLVHSEIADIASRDTEGITKTALSEIPEIEEQNWSQLRTDLLNGKLHVAEMTTSPISFSVFAADSDVAGLKLFHALSILAPVIAIVMAFIFSWWWLAAILLSPIFSRIAKSFYRTVIFQAVTASEQAFCFLFSRNTICLVKDGNTLFRRND